MGERLLPGDRQFVLSKAQVRLAQAAMAHRDTSVSELCRELGVTPGTLLPPLRRPAGPDCATLVDPRGSAVRTGKCKVIYGTHHEHGEKVLAA